MIVYGRVRVVVGFMSMVIGVIYDSEHLLDRLRRLLPVGGRR